MKLTKDNSVAWIQEQVAKIPEYPNTASGRGIVTCSGGKKLLTNTYAGVRLLRDKGCTLPVEVFYLNDAEEEAGIFELLRPLNVKFINVEDLNWTLPIRHTNLHGWESKAFAIRHSSFNDILFLDADVFIDGDPEWVFDSPEYKQFGTIFMPDGSHMSADREWWQVHGLEYRDEPEVESGIIYLNKSRSWQAICLTDRLCEYGTRFFWNYQYGDKESFRAAWHILGQAYFQEPQGWKSLPGTMVHTLLGKKIFFHRNRRKLHLISNDVTRGFPNEETIFGYLKELRQVWNPYFPEGDTEATRQLEGMRCGYIRLGVDKRSLEFGKDHTFKISPGDCEKYYSVIDGKLNIYSNNGDLTMSLIPFEDGGWVGRWQIAEKGIVLLLKN